MTTLLFDPSIASSNLGDQIIIEAVKREISNLLPSEQIITAPTQEVISNISLRQAKNAKFRFVGGTNLLSSKMLRYAQWKIGLLQALKLKNVTLMGVGWWQYQPPPDLYTRTILRSILSHEEMHSVRDEYTRRMLSKIGIKNTINTGCPTMWQLTPEHCESITARRSTKAVLTLTDYHQDKQRDRNILDLLQKFYSTVYFWPQGSGDLRYLDSLRPIGVIRLTPSLRDYDQLLSSDDDIDFIGTRLHGGVRALQFKHRALIIAVDNRAQEISKDTGLPVAARDDLESIRKWIKNPGPTLIRMDSSAIDKWREQFK
ncbi:polysaccharide pyruvyl transferase family protein [Ideonella dechloratans]|uniref:Polysaccharide pyruvyl transferase family protein n=1 Tax=Ideonella dechloratans TaxID=36863 RepID=A0A643FDH2_IDEDE|nr:polysaccharide pyruvyl transferase family protein [Ideonella dechloratans]KAB0583588.1 polysaccharide pyruvyl transferase family protein [Ideonella dechloratans]UFU11103.1 polysaccharide pyruvyl transferase family protein [Ideonella dechloratans]